MNLGTARGRDIASICPNVVEAEVFAAVNPQNNGKVDIDIERMDKSRAANQYVFFYAPLECPGRRCDREQPNSKVQVWALSREEIM